MPFLVATATVQPVGIRRAEGLWRAHPGAAGALRLLVVLVPVGASLGLTALFRRLLPAPEAVVLGALRWLAFVCLALTVAMLVERQARRLLPLASLLRLGMLFPDEAPSRYAVARRAGSLRRLQDHLEKLERDPNPVGEAECARTILALAVALQTHDRKTRGHAERVRVYTDLLGEELGLSKEDRYRLRWAALLHDVGKLSVPTRILNKEGALDEREWEDIRQHPLEGARIAAPLMPWLGRWAWAIIDHHERVDGRGYPAGLTGTEISLAGRIVSVADAYDSMTSARSYKKPIAVRAARQELADCAGTQFDVDIVRAFFAISLPRLLWKTGPLSLVFHLPYLSEVEAVGKQALVAASHGVTAATVAATITAVGMGGPVAASASVPVAGHAAVLAETVSHEQAAPSGVSSDESAQDEASASVSAGPGSGVLAAPPTIEADDDATADGVPVQADHERDDRGQSDGQDGETDTTPGQSGGSHGQSDAAHGQNNVAHGQSGASQGQSDTTHGRSDGSHGQGDGSNGQNGTPPASNGGTPTPDPNGGGTPTPNPSGGGTPTPDPSGGGNPTPAPNPGGPPNGDPSNGGGGPNGP